MRRKREIVSALDKLGRLFDVQTIALSSKSATPSVIESKQLEMSGALVIGVSNDELAKEAPEWYAGYKYGVLRGLYRALYWIVENDPSEDDLTDFS